MKCHLKQFSCTEAIDKALAALEGPPLCAALWLHSIHRSLTLLPNAPNARRRLVALAAFAAVALARPVQHLVTLRGGLGRASAAGPQQVATASAVAVSAGTSDIAEGENCARDSPAGPLHAMETHDRMRKADPSAPPVTRQDVLACQIGEWYPVFSRHTLKTKFVDLSPEFVEYILADGLILPVGCEAPSAHSANDGDDDSWADFSGSDSEAENGGGGQGGDCDESGQPTRPNFDDIVESMNKAIEDLGGEVFPKLMWSCPRDATWINAGENIRCVSAADVIMLLKSSDFIVHDLCHPFDCCVESKDDEGRGTSSLSHDSRICGASQPAESPGGTGEGGDAQRRRPRRVVLALRKWFEGLRSCMEFRCFVRQEQLVGISQRDCAQAFPFLMESKRQIVDALGAFHRDAVRSGPACPACLQPVFDAPLPRAHHARTLTPRSLIPILHPRP